MQTFRYDIVIVGGGIIGTALACLLAQQTDLSIALLEANKESNIPWEIDNHHHRVSAVTLASQRILKYLQLWEKLSAKRISPFHAIHVWDAATKSEVQFDCHTINATQLGFIVENNLLQTTLQEKLAQFPQIKYIAPVNLVSLQKKQDYINLLTADDVCYQASLAIAADGAQSWLRKQANISVNKHDYQQTAIVATVQTTLPHQQIARQVFLPTGPLAFLPLLPSHTSSIVWTLPTSLAQEKMLLDDLTWQQMLTTIFPYLQAITAVGPRYAFPLYKQQAAHYIKPHIALVGDAAHIVHPLAGQGVNIGLLDAASLAETIRNASQNFATMPSLRRYERWRRAENALMLTGIDLLKQCFASQSKIMQTMRAAGLHSINHIATLKKLFISQAVGNSGTLPAIAQENDQYLA